MNDIDLPLKEVHDEIFNNGIVKEYFRLKKQIEDDKELFELEKQVRFHQRNLCKLSPSDAEFEEEKKIYDELSSKLNSHPIYTNFLLIKNEINELLIDIRDFLS